MAGRSCDADAAFVAEPLLLSAFFVIVPESLTERKTKALMLILTTVEVLVDSVFDGERIGDSRCPGRP